MATVLLIGILASMAVPQYERAVWRRRREAALDVLRAIYAGEQTYWTQNNQYAYRAVDSTATEAAAQFRDIYTPLPTVDGVTFQVTASGQGATATFTARAARSPNCTITIDQAWDPQSTEASSWVWNPNGTC